MASLHDLRDAIGEKALVEFVQLDGSMHALVVTAGKGTLHHLGPRHESPGSWALRFG